MSLIIVELPPLATNPEEWTEAMRKFHWRRSFECYAAELDELAEYHRRQALRIQRRMKAKRDGQ